MARVLFLTSRFPFPLEKGDKLRAYNQIKQLSRTHEVHLFSLSETTPSSADLDALRPYCASISDHTVPRWKRLLRLPMAFVHDLPFQVQYFHDPAALHAIRALIAALRPDVVHTHLIRMSPYASTTRVPRTTLDYMDCFSIGAEREATWARQPKRAFLLREAQRLRNYERRVFRDVDAACIISKADGAQMAIPDPESLVLVPNGVDTEVFHPLEREKRYDVLFTGHMAYPPNIAAVHYTATQVMPCLLALRPEARLLIAGVGAPPSIHALASDHVVVVERFEHIREAFAMSRLMLAPMSISIGLQNKILQAMAMEIPVVTTAQGNAAIGAESGRHLFVGDGPAEIAAQAHRLLVDEELRMRMVSEARTYVQERYTWQQACAPLERMLVP